MATESTAFNFQPDLRPENEPLGRVIDSLPADALHEPEPKSEFACTYCGLDSPASVAQCGTCDKWFCNGSGTLVASHMVTHLALSKHKTVCLHESSPLGAETLECYNCGNKNIFNLGFVAAKKDSVVVILCRMPCAHKRDINWETNDWSPLIENRFLLPWISPVPSAEQMATTIPVTDEMVRKLEAQWRMNKVASISDFDAINDNVEELLPVLLRFNDGAAYHNSWVPLVDAEAQCNKLQKESQALEHISLTWGVSHWGTPVADFSLSTYESSSLTVAIGDSLDLHYRESGTTTEEKWSGRCRVISLPSARKESFTVELIEPRHNAPTHATTGFTVEFLWAGTPYFRMLNALDKFANQKKSVSAHIYHSILGHEVVNVQFKTKLPQDFSLDPTTPLNASQQKAISLAMTRPLTLIQGPPGTGKTVVSSAIVHHLSKLRKSRILVCAPSNVAVDHLTLKLHAAGLNAVRVYSRARESVDGTTLDCSLSSSASKKLPGNLRKLLKKQSQGETLTSKQLKALNAELSKVEDRILKSADAVCCTCVTASDFRIKGNFDTVLIDESTQACEPELLIPIVRGAKQVILVGDHQQLGPVIMDDRAKRAGLSQSLFERLIAMGHVSHRLEVQYRMHPSLSEFSSNMFYEGSLQNGVSSEDRTLAGSTFPWPVHGMPMMFWGNYGKEELSPSGTSYLNRVEAMNVEKVISRLFRDGVKPEQIGVITPYEGQRAYIAHYLQINSSDITQREAYENVEILSVDSFQGREKDYIILSCVRANEERTIGFLSDPRRLNVALTRAKYGMVVIGNPRSLSRNKLWNHLLVHYRERGCLVEGPLDNLQLSLVSLSGPGPKSRAHFLAKNHEMDDDLESMLSYAPDDHFAAPNLPQIGQDESFDDAAWPSLTSNQVSQLDAPDGRGKANGVAANGNGHDLQDIADILANALNI